MITKEFKELLVHHNAEIKNAFEDYVIKTSEGKYTIRYQGKWQYCKKGELRYFYLYKVVKGEIPTEGSEPYKYLGITKFNEVKEFVPVKLKVPSKPVFTKYIPKEDIDKIEWELIV